MKKVLVIDNYDSFTYNLVHALEELLEHQVEVKKNDEIQISEIENYDYLFLSPGPGLPDQAGLLKEIISTYKSTKKILGICLGLQAIAEVYGCSLRNLEQVYHGLLSEVDIIQPSILYKGISSGFIAGRYHSWVMDEGETEDLIITGKTKEGHIMSIEHTLDKVYAVQYHPESFMTPMGKKILGNFLALSQ